MREIRSTLTKPVLEMRKPFLFFWLRLTVPQRRFFLLSLCLQKMLGDIQQGKPVPGKAGSGCFPAFPLLPFQFFPFLFPPFSGVFLFLLSSSFLLILPPLLPADMTDRLWSGLVEYPLGVVAGLEVSEPFTQPGHTEIPVHTGCLDRRISHENDSAGT